MSEFVIVTDSNCDLPPQLADELGLSVLPMIVTVGEDTYKNYLDEREITSRKFYDMLRNGAKTITAAANPERLRNHMTPILDEGKDVLMLSFSSGLSSTYASAALVAAELSEEYPERKVFVVDTLAASMGQGLLVYHAAMEKAKGKTIEEVRDYAESIKLNLCHWFTVDDLNHLKRGGRVSKTTAAVGTLLNIKPVLHVDDEGHLINMSKARGRAASLRALQTRMRETITNPEEQVIFISHGDSLADAQSLAADIKEEFKVKDVVISAIGPVIGSHSGPGTIALFFLGTKR